MRWYTNLRQHLHVTAIEARALMVVSCVFAVGTLASLMTTDSSLHEHATADRIEQILDSLQINDQYTAQKPPADTSTVQPPSQRLPDRQHRPLNGVINLNTASLSDLDALPGVGPATAKAITEARKRNRFTSVDDLLDVKGIGEKKLERIRSYVTAP